MNAETEISRLKSVSEYSDTELIKMMSSGRQQSEIAFNEIFNRYSSTVLAYCKCLIKEKFQAEDVFQETFIRFFNSVKSKKDMVDIANILGFLITIARNLCLNVKRDTKKTTPVENLSLATDNGNNYEKTELLELIIMAMEFIEPIYRDAFILREFDGLHYKEIGKKIGISTDNAKQRVIRAKQKIINFLQPYISDINREF